jgi:hypothetical protein
MKKISCAEAKQIDLIDYLAKLGHYIYPVEGWHLSCGINGT